MLFRPPPPRTAVPVRLSNLLSALRTAVRQSRVAGRFTGPVDWLRLVVLGVVLVNLAAFALADTIFNGKIANGSGLLGDLRRLDAVYCRHPHRPAGDLSRLDRERAAGTSALVSFLPAIPRWFRRLFSGFFASFSSPPRFCEHGSA